MVSDNGDRLGLPCVPRVSIRFEVRGGFRLAILVAEHAAPFQSALRFAVVSDTSPSPPCPNGQGVSIRFEVRGGFRREGMAALWDAAIAGFNPL